MIMLMNLHSAITPGDVRAILSRLDAELYDETIPFEATARRMIAVSETVAEMIAALREALAELSLALTTFLPRTLVAIGIAALQSNATGYDNTAVGREALSQSNATDNTAVGAQALQVQAAAHRPQAGRLQVAAALRLCHAPQDRPAHQILARPQRVFHGSG